MIKLRTFKGQKRNTEQSLALHEIILQIVLSTFEITEKEFKSKIRKKHLVAARQIYCKIVLNYTDLTLYTIREKMNKDHSTVLHSVKVANNRINPIYNPGIIYKNLNFSELFNNIETQVENNYYKLYKGYETINTATN